MKYKKQNGFAILIVLVAVVILMLLYFVQIDTLFGPGLPSEPAGIEEHPWVLEELLIAEDQPVKPPRSPKPELNEPFSVAAAVVRNGADRGTVTIAFGTDGRIRAAWDCVYRQSEIDYRVNAETRGNIHTKRTYQDDNGKDKSRLFFIAKGRYTKIPLESTESIGGEKGQCWLIGWIGPDRSVRGHLTLTQNRQWAAAYAFESAPETAPTPH